MRKRTIHWYKFPFYGIIYRTAMRISHKFGWHYAPLGFVEDGYMRWCQWCGFRESYKKVKGIDGKPTHAGLCVGGMVYYTNRFK